jgi:heat shock protein HslJ
MRRITSVLIVLLMTVAACGGSDTDDTSAPDDTTTTTAAASGSTTTATAAPSSTTTTTAEPSVDAPELGGTSWNVTDYRLPDGSITNVWKTDVTIAFGDDGTVSGSSGCNDYEGTWAVAGAWNEFESGVPDPEDGQELILSDLAWTERACEDDAIMEQEGEILDLLQNGARWVLIRGSFHLRDAEGSFLFEAEPA